MIFKICAIYCLFSSLLSGSSGGLLGSSLLGTLGGSGSRGSLLNLLLGTGVDELGGVDSDGTDESLGSQLLDGLTGQRAVNLKTISNDGRSDDLVGRKLLHELVVGLLVEDNLVLQLLLSASLGPLLNGNNRIYHNKNKRITTVRDHLKRIQGL